jgi:hypothetical protein
MFNVTVTRFDKFAMVQPHLSASVAPWLVRHGFDAFQIADKQQALAFN